MMRRVLFAFFFSIVPAAALANSCPSSMAAIDAALPSANVPKADMTKAKELRAKGEELHAAGDHAGSVAALNEAKTLLGI